MDGVGSREMGFHSRVRGMGFCVQRMVNSTFVSSYILEYSALSDDCPRRYLARGTFISSKTLCLDNRMDDDIHFLNNQDLIPDMAETS